MEAKQFIIADSGSTKTDWTLIPMTGPALQVKTQGLNPYFTTEAELASIVKDQLLSLMNKDLPIELHFYGSGCGNPQHRDFYFSIFQSLGVERATIETDLMGVARAAFGLNEGIAGILGTGANAGLFSKGVLLRSAPSTGFMLGDEGSAAWIGKQLLSAWLRKQLPDDIYRSMTAILPSEVPVILQRVYSEMRPNRFIASLATVLNDFSDHPWVVEMLEEGFTAFFRNYIRILDASPSSPVILAGTVANVHAHQLRKIFIREGYGNFAVLPSVIDGLVRFHQSC